MSRIGRQIISIPDKVEVNITQGGVITVKGPLGSLTRQFKSDIIFSIKDKEITLAPISDTVLVQALWGTYASHLKNMIDGVTTGFTKKLIIEGIGYKANLKGDVLELDIGFSHKVLVSVPASLKVLVEKNIITVSGYDKEMVGEFSALVRAHKKSEPYKGKGIHYEGEVVRRKQGKKTVS